MHEVFAPDEVFRIDHYLGKETVQNILALRFANTMFEPIWNRSYVDHVQITMAEDIGIGGRAGYYDGIGAARDVIQNHLLQLHGADRHGGARLLRRRRAGRREAQGARRRAAARGPGRAHRARAVRGAAGRAARRCVGYLEEDGIDPKSKTDTYAADQAGGRQPPLGGRPVLPAHRQAARPPGHRDRGRLPARPALPLRLTRPPRSWARTRWSSGSSRTRA